MEKFDLSVWLQDKSRKVVTRDGREVALFGSLSGNELYPVKGMVEKNPTIYTWTETGISYCNGNPQSNDLFFADEEEELTEFESKLADLLVYNHPMDIESAESIAKRKSKQLLDLARKELEKSIENGAIEFAKSYMEDVNPSFEKVKDSEELWKWKMSCLRGMNKAYTQGKQDALKDLPKWKNVKEKSWAGTNDYKIIGYYLVKGDYAIYLENLENLPKEE